VTKWRQIEVLHGRDKTIAMAYWETGTTELLKDERLNGKSATVSGKLRWAS
jgi:hypothetical protein